MKNFLFPVENNVKVEGNVNFSTKRIEKRKEMISAANLVLDASLSEDPINWHFELTLKNVAKKVLST